MVDIELSMMLHNGKVNPILRPILDEFEAQTGIHVNLTILDWETGRAELNKIALYHHGPDVSEIGSTWVGDMISMNSLRPFSARDLAKIGNPEEFIASSWDTCRLVGDKSTWAVPMLCESYLIHYRRDIFAKAGIDENTAFLTHESMEDAAARLAEYGVEFPAMPIYLQDRHGAMHALASWVWTAGGDFTTPDGKTVTFEQPAALKAMTSFFRFFRHIQPEKARDLLGITGPDLFVQGRAAMIIGSRSYKSEMHDHVTPEFRENWASAMLPGERFTGGANLVIWKHTHYDDAALDLVRYLMDPGVIMRFALKLNMLPPRKSLLDHPEIAAEQGFQVMAEAVQKGRSYHSIPLLGLIEDRFIPVLIQTGRATLTDFTTPIEEIIEKAMVPTARRLNLTLSK